MADKKGTKTKKKPEPQRPRLNLAPFLQREIIGIVLVLAAILTVLSLLSASRSPITEGWVNLLRFLFGWGVYVVPILMGVGGIALFARRVGDGLGIPWERYLGGMLLFVVAMGLMHVLSFSPDPWRLASDGQGGGLLGWAISEALSSALGPVGEVIVLVALGGVSLILLLNVSLAQMGTSAAAKAKDLGDAVRRARPSGVAVPPPPRPASTPATQPASRPLAEPQGRLVGRLVGEPDRLTPAFRPDAGPPEWHLPDIAQILQENIEQELSQAEIRQKVRTIEETLASFGVPAKVVEVNQGPTITQFGVEPGYVERRDPNGQVHQVKVKVGRIAALGNDLALALAAAPIRIEAPVPGRNVIGIEVPNREVALVALRSVMESETFKKFEGKLKLALGQDVSGNAIVADLTAMPHLLIAGATGSGKSVCINSIIACLLCTHTPQDLRLVMIDPKMVELTNFNGLPHLIAPVVVDIERVVGTLTWATREMDRRYRLFSEAGTRNIEAYNATIASSLASPHNASSTMEQSAHPVVTAGDHDTSSTMDKPQSIVRARDIQREPLPYIVIFIDELADLMMIAPEEVERLVCRIAQLARATGIHLVMATQRPSVDVVTGLIKANFPARISFAVTSQVDSRVVLDAAGAEKLLGRGDMLYMASDSSKLVRLQGCFVSDTELDRLVKFWKGLGQGPSDFSAIGGPQMVQQTLWPDWRARERMASTDDDLLDEAIEVAKQYKGVSISLLQRKLRIGYSRAARLMDLMEKRGLVGPAAAAGKPREVRLDEEEGDEDTF